MSINEVLVILWRRGWIAALTLLTAIIVAVGVLVFVPGRYDAVATASVDTAGVDLVTASQIGGSPAAIGLMQGNTISLVQSHRVALEVVKRLNLIANPQLQKNFRNSDSFGRESIEDWIADSLIDKVVPSFLLGTNVLSIKYKSADPNQAATIANAFLAATIDAAIAMKASSGEQAAVWFTPQLQELRNQVTAAREALEAFQKKTNIVAPSSTGVDTESNALLAIDQQLSSGRAAVTAMQARLASDKTELAMDSSDPDLQTVNGLKEKLTAALATVEAAKGSLGANNPKMIAATANIASLRKQLSDATEKMREHLKGKIASTKDQISRLEVEQAQARRNLIDAQAQRNRLLGLQRDLGFRMEELNSRERAAAQAKLQSKLTFAAISPLDKATPPIAPAFPKPMIVIPVALGAGLVLGVILALLAEMTDRRVRSPNDLRLATSAPNLGVIIKARKVSSIPTVRRRALT